ncbi:MAG: XTP/dITP diphosphatase [Desulfobacterales bacterium]|nr:XTP/dITP diphosphatase [Desulfobacterales bacterium]
MSRIVMVLATHNKGKQREYELLSGNAPIALRGLSEFEEVPLPDEEGRTFEEIATKKARAVSMMLGVPALADDSGLAVEALNGAPGVLSARYAGESADDYQNNHKLLEEMRGRENRKATFYCAIALAKPGGLVLNYAGRCSGIILDEPAGAHGFGYDPIFYYPPLRKTFAQLSPEEKNSVSHRGQAMRKFLNDLERILTWLGDR